MILENAGYDALNASSGEQALLLFSSHDVNLVLLDYQMPGMNGDVVILTMKMRQKCVPVVIVSSSVIPPEVANAADAVIEKGLGPAFLLSTMREVLMRHRLDRP